MLTSHLSLIRSHFLRLLSMGMMFAVVIVMISLVQQIIANIDQQIASQTKPIVGADMIIESSQPLMGEIFDFVEKNIGKQNQIIQTVQFYTTIGQTNDPKLVQVKGIQDGYPLYGDVEIEYLIGRDVGLPRPGYIGQGKPMSLQGIYIDPQTYTLINQSGSIQLGQVNLPILGIITKQASLGFNFLNEGRTILMPYDLVAQTKLTDIGSRVQYQLQIKLADESQGPILKKQIESQFDRQYNVSLASWRISQLSGIIDQLNQYTSIILIITLILSLTFMSIATMTMTDRIKQSIAVMRILGLTKTKIMLLCVMLFGSMFVLALGLGYLCSYLLFSYISSLEVAKEFIRQTNLLLKLGIISVISFLISCRVPIRYLVDTHPLTLLKSSETQLSNRDRWIGFLLFVIGSFVILYILTSKLIFSIIAIASFCIGIGFFHYFIQWLFGRIYFSSKQYSQSHFSRFDSIRQTILPGNQTSLLVGSLLVSLLAYCVIMSVSLSFIDRLEISSIDQPNIFVLNVRTQDVATIQQFDTGAKLYDTILARIQSIKGNSLSDYLKHRSKDGSESREFTREFNTTTRSLSNSPRIKGTELTGGGLSLDENFAKSLGLTIGDKITIFIQGRTFDLTVTSLRKRIATGSEPFFFLQLDAEQFNNAPRSRFRVTRTADIPNFKSKAIETIGNHLSFIEIEAIISLVTDIAQKVIAIIIACMGLILILIICVSIASNEASAMLSQQGYRLYHIIGMTKSQLLQKSWKIVEIYSFFILAFVLVLVPLLLWYIYSVAPLLTWSWGILSYMVGGVGVSLGLMIGSFVWFHRGIIVKH